MPSYQSTIDLYNHGRETNLHDSLRKGQLLDLTAPGEAIMTGDLHGHEPNFDKIIHFAALNENPHRHLILHEMLHAPRPAENRGFSFRLLERALRLQKIFPRQVHFLLGNHALSQAFGKPLARTGGDAVKILRAGLAQTYGEHAQQVGQAMSDFLLSEPLAVRLPNRIMLSHSLPTPVKMSRFDPGVLYKNRLDKADLQHNGSAYLLLWGRRQGAEQLARLGRAWDVDLFITGHQPQEMGFVMPNPRQIILASDTNHGCCLPIDLSRSYSLQQLSRNIVKLAAVR